MGMYLCKLSKVLQPKYHNEWHGDICSTTCPILKEEMQTSLDTEDWNRLKELIKLGEQYDFIDPS